MRGMFWLLLFLLNPQFLTAQQSDLREKVDSIIQFQIGYQIDSTTNKLPDRNWNTSVPRGLYPSFSSLPNNPMPLIVLNGSVVDVQELDKYSLAQLEMIRVFGKGEVGTVLYGTSAQNGLVVLDLKD